MPEAHPESAGLAREAIFARFYDLEYSDYAEDIEFYVQYALAMDPDRKLPVLELGCGTGRVLLALAEAGFQVTGLDASAAMLEACRAHARERNLEDSVTLVEGDMRSLERLPHKPYNVAFCALNTFAYVTTTDEQLEMLRSVAGALVQHGLLVLDLTPPVRHLLPPDGGEVVYQGSYPDPERRAIVHKFVTGYEEPSMQTHQVRLIYDVEAADGTLQRFSKPETFRWTGRYEMELLLRAAGYRLEKIYGSYELDDYGDASERMIFVART